MLRVESVNLCDSILIKIYTLNSKSVKLIIQNHLFSLRIYAFTVKYIYIFGLESQICYDRGYLGISLAKGEIEGGQVC